MRTRSLTGNEAGRQWAQAIGEHVTGGPGSGDKPLPGANSATRETWSSSETAGSARDAAPSGLSPATETVLPWAMHPPSGSKDRPASAGTLETEHRPPPVLAIEGHHQIPAQADPLSSRRGDGPGIALCWQNGRPPCAGAAAAGHSSPGPGSARLIWSCLQSSDLVSPAANEVRWVAMAGGAASPIARVSMVITSPTALMRAGSV